MSETFVLIHGSWHGGWAWQAVVRHLEAKGHRAYAPTLPGHEPGAERAGIALQDYIDAVVSSIKQHDLRDVTLVGQSFGGVVISKVAEYLSSRIQRLVFLDAFVLEDNQCLNDTLPGAFAQLFKQLAQASADNTITLPWEIWRNNFIQDAPEEVARVLWEFLSSEPYQPAREQLDLKAFYSLNIPKSYISCRQDISFPPGFFHPGMSSRLGIFKLVEMDGNHEVMFTRPAEVAEKLIEASSE
jgi:pimeloyl-ACP methyl ester carboxylesterase